MDKKPPGNWTLLIEETCSFFLEQLLVLEKTVRIRTNWVILELLVVLWDAFVGHKFTGKSFSRKPSFQLTFWQEVFAFFGPSFRCFFTFRTHNKRCLLPNGDSFNASVDGLKLPWWVDPTQIPMNQDVWNANLIIPASHVAACPWGILIIVATYCWWFGNTENQLRLAVLSRYLKGFRTIQKVVQDFFHQHWNPQFWDYFVGNGPPKHVCLRISFWLFAMTTEVK